LYTTAQGKEWFFVQRSSTTLLLEGNRMYTSLVLFALAGSAVPAAETPEASAWLSDYAAACKKGQSEQKPLAVVFGKGNAGWHQLSRDGTLGAEALQQLRSAYVPVYVDLATEHGKNLATAFEVKAAPALVISDRSGDKMALRYAGTLEAGDLRRCLSKYADPERVCRVTDTDPNAEVRYYAPAAPVQAAPPQMYPAVGGFGGFGGFGGGGGGGC
jgi:hypothetical protein